MNTRCPLCDFTFESEVAPGLKGACPRCMAGFLDTPAVPPDDTALPLKPGATFRGLEVLQVLGRGGMGVVYRARQPGLDRTVALKVMLPKLAGDAEFAARFNREAKALATLNHPNIVQVYEFGREGDLLFLVMECVDGVSLRECLRDRRMEPPEALRLVRQICDALEYAHAQGVVHRDIKPENILIERRAVVKIADFGLAKVAGPGAGALTQSNVVIGTPHYMAPEQYEDLRSVDHRADIYSLGVVFYEMLTGELPVGRFELPSQRTAVDVRIDEVVLRALEKRLDRRYQRVAEVKTDLDAAEAAPMPPPPRPRRRRWLMASASVIAIGTVLVAWFARTPVQDDSTKVERLLAALTGDSIEERHSAVEELGRLGATDARVRPRLDAAFEKAGPELRERLQAVRAEIAFQEARRVKPTSRSRIDGGRGGASVSLAVSPDGKTVASGGTDGRLVLLNADDMREPGVGATPDGDVRHLAFSPDGEWLAGSHERTLSVWEVRSGKRIAAFAHDRNYGAPFCFLPDKRLCLGRDKAVEVWDVPGQKRERTLESPSVHSVSVAPDGASIDACATEGVWRWSVADWSGGLLYEPTDRWIRVRYALSLAASKDGRRVAEIRSWNRELRVVVRDLDRKADDVAGTRWVFSSIRSAPAAGCFAFDTQGDEKGIEIVRWSDLRTLAFIPCADAYAWDLAPDGKHLFAGVPGGIAKIETATGREMARASPHRAWIGGYAFHPDGQSIVTVGPDGFVHFRAVDDGRELGAFRPEGGASGEFDMSRDGAFMVSVRSNELLLCDLGQRKVLRRIPREDVRCSGVTFAMPDVVLVAEGFGGVRAYDTSGRAPTRWIVESLTPQRYAGDTSHSDWSAASFSPDGSLVARTVWGHGIDVYETATGTRRFTIAERPDFGLAFSHDASRLLYSTVGGVVKAVDAKTGHELSSAAVGGSDLRITADPTGRYAAVASGDTIALLHAPTMKEVTRFEVRNHWRVRFSPKGETLAVSVRDAMLLYDLNLPVQSGK